MSDTPATWTWSTIGEVTQCIQRGKSPKYAAQSALPVINQKCIRWDELQLQHLKYIHPDQFEAWDESRYIKPGDILWNSTGTGTVGRAYLVEEKDCTSPKVVDSHVTIVRASAGLEPRYLFAWIKSPAVQDKIVEMCDGTTNQIELSRTAIAATQIPVAPAEEQIRIADQLDTLLARINACQRRLDNIPALLKRFRQAVLAAATSGLLTEDFRRTPAAAVVGGMPADWTKSNIQAIANDLRYGTSKKCDYSTSGVGVLRIPNIADHGRIDVRDLKSAQFEEKEVEKLVLAVGDLLVIRSNGSVELVGKTSIVTEKESGLLFAGYLMRLRVNAELALPAFVRLCLAAPLQRKYIELTAKSTSGVNNLNAEELRSLPLWLPKPNEQAEIVRRVEKLFKLADRIEGRYTAALAQAQRLPSLVLAKAFRGELLPQDPGDEPASELLARIAAQRKSATPPPKTRQPRAPRAARAPKESAAMTKSRQDADVKGKPYLAGHLRRLGEPVAAQALFQVAELPVADFYKQLAWEVAQGHVKDNTTTLEPSHAAG